LLRNFLKSAATSFHISSRIGITPIAVYKFRKYFLVCFISEQKCISSPYTITIVALK
jgi:hypothetical protein